MEADSWLERGGVGGPRSCQGALPGVEGRGLRWCRAHKEELQAEVLAAQLAGSDAAGFWSGLRALSPDSHTLPLRVDQAAGEEDIAYMWVDHFEGTLNCVADVESERALRSGLCGVTLEGFRSVNYSELREYCGPSLTARHWALMGFPLVP